MKTFAIATVGLLTTLGGVGEVRAADRHLDQLAFDVTNQTATLVREVRYGYRRHPEFAHLYDDAVEMHRVAERVHDIAHNRAPMTHLAASVNELDELYHHVEDVVSEADATSRYGIDPHHQYRVQRVMAALRETLHHLQDDVSPVGPAAPIAPRAPVAVPPVQPTTPVYSPGLRGRGFDGRGFDRRVFDGRRGFTYEGRSGRFSVRFGH